ncbi:8480_t:CDS:1 [Paraglomus brasilianum]|uniref:8480_t:CDS:1 n=1 Tax=Paraglomus brasilianum TaxID=144538 RepID=A0A9N9CCV4_9GLOM|nr:8480_t:CDS:1 [Paraglomus brasilianum]
MPDHWLNTLAPELKVEIILHLSKPTTIAGCSREWYNIVNLPFAKAKWLISRHGKTHALFHAVRMGKPFINPDVVECLFAQGAHISRYFIQRLVLGFGECDRSLIDLKQKYNIGPPDPFPNTLIQDKTCSSWASSLPVDVYFRLLKKGCDRFGEENISVRGNDMEKFYYLSGGPLGTSQSRVEIQKNMDEIKELIGEHKFVPFPPKPGIRNPYLPCDISNGYTDVLKWNIIARPIQFCLELVNLWKENGYHEVVAETNDIVIRGSLLFLYRQEYEEWVPELKQVVEKLSDLQSYGFKLTDKLVGDALRLFENRLDFANIGETLVEAFAIVRKQLKEDILIICLTELLHPKRHVEQYDSLDFIISRVNKPEDKILYAFEKYGYSTNDGVYEYMLEKFGARSRVAMYLYDKPKYTVE